MATAKVMVYPYLVISEKGEVERVTVQGYPGQDQVSEYSHTFHIHLPPVEIEVSHPDDVRAACVELLRHDRKEKTAEHTKLMTQYQFMENQLLGLAAPEVLDAVPKAVKSNPLYEPVCLHCGMAEADHLPDSHKFELDDDIPF